MSNRGKKDNSRAQQSAEEDIGKDCECASCGKHPQSTEERIAEEAAKNPESDPLDQMTREEQNANASDIFKRLDESEKEAAKNRDLYMRAVADLDTYRRKVQREKDELAKFAQAPLIEELLPSLDHLEMAIAAAKSANEAPALTSGVEMVCAQVKKVFESFGVKEVEAEGKDFDPKFEDCVAHEPSDKIPENSVIKVMRRGYILNGRLIRPASVVVSSGKAKKK